MPASAAGPPGLTSLSENQLADLSALLRPVREDAGDF